MSSGDLDKIPFVVFKRLPHDKMVTLSQMGDAENKIPCQVPVANSAACYVAS